MGYLNLVDSFVYKQPLFRAKLDALAENDSYLNDNGWNAATKTIFFQAAVPTGWTKDSSQNDKALRVVGSTGGGVAGGTQALSTTIPIAHTHSISADGGHTHTFANHTHLFETPGTSAPFGVGYANTAAAPGFLLMYALTGGAAHIDLLNAIMSTPGALTLGTEAAHDHGGATQSSLSDVAFAYCDVIIGTRDAPSGSYTDLTSYWHTGDKIDFDPMVTSAANDTYNYGKLMPSGTIMIFGQASAPAGWTKLTTMNDRMLRVVSGVGGGSGGSQPTSSGVALAHANTVTAKASHTHSVPAHQHLINQSSSSITTGLLAGIGSAIGVAAAYVQANGFNLLVDSLSSGGTSTQTAYKAQSTNSGSGSTDAQDGHTHVLPSALADFIFAYVDMIQCSKDSAGAPYAYQDLSARFAWKKLVSRQRLNDLAKNDAYIKYHLTPVGTKALFYMGTPPSGWTKDTTQHDKALRIVSGGSGGSQGGGAQGLSATISLAHTHSIPTDADHHHDVSHTHPLDSGSVSATGMGFTNVRTRTSGTGGVMGHQVAVSTPSSAPALQNSTSSQSSSTTGDAGGHNHGGITGSALSDVVLAYADVIYCTKD